MVSPLDHTRMHKDPIRRVIGDIDHQVATESLEDIPDLSSLRYNFAANYQPIPGASTRPQQSEFLKITRALNP